MNKFTLLVLASIATSVGCASSAESSEDTEVVEADLTQKAAFELDYILMNSAFAGKGGAKLRFEMTGGFDETLGYHLTLVEQDGAVSTADFKMAAKPGDIMTRIATVSKATGTLKTGTMEVRGYSSERETYLVMSGKNGRITGRLLCVNSCQD